MTGSELAQIYEFSYGAIQRNLDAEGEQTIGRQAVANPLEYGLKGTEIDQDVGGEDQVV